MKMIFLCERPERIKDVYPKTVIDKLGICENIFCKNDLYSNDFSNVEYVFSTWGMPVLTEDEIKKYLPSLRAVFYAAGTVQTFARPFLNCGVKVFSAWAANAVPVAEYTVAQIILANKGMFRSSLTYHKNGRSKAREVATQYIGNYNAKIGIIGAGMIGKLVIKMLKSYNLEVMAFDPFLPDDTATELGVKKVSLKTLFCECDVVSNHLANNEQTQGMLNKPLFESMKQNATFINTGRGAQVVENDLVSVLENRPDITALLDVTFPEPPVENHPFYTLENCILTPHIAGSSGNEVWRMAEYMADEYEKLVSGNETNYEVTLKMLETMA